MRNAGFLSGVLVVAVAGCTDCPVCPDPGREAGGLSVENTCATDGRALDVVALIDSEKIAAAVERPTIWKVNCDDTDSCIAVQLDATELGQGRLSSWGVITWRSSSVKWDRSSAHLQRVSIGGPALGERTFLINTTAGTLHYEWTLSGGALASRADVTCSTGSAK